MFYVLVLEALICESVPPVDPVPLHYPQGEIQQWYTDDLELAQVIAQVQVSVAQSLYEEDVSACLMKGSEGWAIYVY